MIFSVESYAEEFNVEREYDFNIQPSNAADALSLLARKTNAIVLFPYAEVKTIFINPVAGRYTLTEVLRIMLRDTGISSGISDKGVIKISVVGDEQTSEERRRMTYKKIY